MSPLDDWLAAQAAASADAIAAAISATHLTHRRPGFGHVVVPAAGSILASPEDAHWDPEPDYFYHWPRDAGVVMLAAALLHPQDPAAWDRRFADYVTFSLAIATRAGPPANPQRATTDAAHARFLRPDAELTALAGDAVPAEPRVNADGTADFEEWGRPQYDGPALRALSCLAWPGAATAETERLLAIDLAHVLAHAAAPCIGPWEDPPPARHAFTMLAQRAALCAAGPRLAAAGVAEAVARIDTAMGDLRTAGRFAASSATDGSDADIILGALLDPAGRFGVTEPAMAATAEDVERWSRARFALATDAAPLVGRWEGDVYFDGQPWLPTSLGFAEFYYRRAAGVNLDAAERRRCRARGEAILEAVRAARPTAGALPEQIDGATGAPRSCRNLTWSHAALIAAAHARRLAG
ncbi:glycoside hydrolase family 15 protein [Acuticoccus sp. I52.16.1]|uniref:glycoside hydrolase family 15 protein n=1 Tax=Acuticoccus sp. I52.16.1 TaxID=2928472 RepID=UPI001FD4E110|nr:glycoside hydrolase family 15 protein [Acuticoccus sp. I52.16.1]UOM32739.1 glycoside hydrolase family 15 protein [Acuticoccus sp. I52.16.1]